MNIELSRWRVVGRQDHVPGLQPSRFGGTIRQDRPDLVSAGRAADAQSAAIERSGRLAQLAVRFQEQSFAWIIQRQREAPEKLAADVAVPGQCDRVSERNRMAMSF